MPFRTVMPGGAHALVKTITFVGTVGVCKASRRYSDACVKGEIINEIGLVEGHTMRTFSVPGGRYHLSLKEERKGATGRSVPLGKTTPAVSS
jgi:hypothetical protein